MDKRFFLALFLSLIVIAVSQLLFPPAKKPPGVNLNLVKDSAGAVGQTGVAASSSTASTTSTAQGRDKPVPAARAGVAGGSLAPTQAAETTEVVTAKAIY